MQDNINAYQLAHLGRYETLGPAFSIWNVEYSRGEDEQATCRVGPLIFVREKAIERTPSRRAIIYSVAVCRQPW